MPIVQQYHKTQLRVILANPGIDITDAKAVSKSPQMDKRKFRQLVQPIIESDCKKILTVSEFNKLKVVPAKVVEKIFAKVFE